jgi:hypothetical protein
MTYSILDQHESIGWDVDGTMYEDHRTRTPETDARCRAMHEYILAHPEKKHYVVTFRSGKWATKVWEDLLRVNPDAPGEEVFVGLLCMSVQMFDENCARNLGNGYYTEPTPIYKEWKGKICAENGITVLVDDNPNHVVPGCDRYGVLHLHAERL